MAHNPDRWLSTAAFFHPVYWALCTTPEAFRAECLHLALKEHEVPSPLRSAFAGASTHYFENYEDGKQAAIVYLPYTDRHINEVHALLVHEAMHLYQYILKCMGEEAPGAEMEAYTVQHLAQALFDAWDEQIEAAAEPVKKPPAKLAKAVK